MNETGRDVTLDAETWYWLTAAGVGVNAFLVWKAAAFYWGMLDAEHRATAVALTLFTLVLVAFFVLTLLMALRGIARPPWTGAAFQFGITVGFGYLYCRIYFNGTSRRP
jgi:hypothetical protein